MVPSGDGPAGGEEEGEGQRVTSVGGDVDVSLEGGGRTGEGRGTVEESLGSAVREAGEGVGRDAEVEEHFCYRWVPGGEGVGD